MHSLQRILPGEQKRKTKKPIYTGGLLQKHHWARGRRQRAPIPATESCGSQGGLGQASRALDGGEHISEALLKEIFAQAGFILVNKQETLIGLVFLSVNWLQGSGCSLFWWVFP